MADSSTSVGRALQDVAAEAARLQTKLARDYFTTLGALARGRLSPQDYLQSVRSEGGRYLRELGRLNIDYARGVQRLVTTSSTRFTGTAETAPTRAAAAPAAKKTTRKTSRTSKTTTAKKKAAAKRPARARRTPRQPA